MKIEYARQLEFPHLNMNIKISFGQGSWMWGCDWWEELSNARACQETRDKKQNLQEMG